VSPGETRGDVLGVSGVIVGSGVTSTLGETDALGEEVGEGDVDSATSDASEVGTGLGSTTTHSCKLGSRSDPTSPPDVSADTADTGATNKAHDSATTSPRRPQPNTT